MCKIVNLASFMAIVFSSRVPSLEEEKYYLLGKWFRVTVYEKPIILDLIGEEVCWLKGHLEKNTSVWNSL